MLVSSHLFLLGKRVIRTKIFIKLKEFLDTDPLIESSLIGASTDFQYKVLVNNYYDRFSLFIQDFSNLRILVIGCGKGKMMDLFHKKINHASKVVGVHISNSLIEKARKLHSSDSLEFICGDILDFELNEQYDIIYFYSVIQYFTLSQFQKF